jgi:hypothetical protein
MCMQIRGSATVTHFGDIIRASIVLHHHLFPTFATIHQHLPPYPVLPFNHAPILIPIHPHRHSPCLFIPSLHCLSLSSRCRTYLTLNPASYIASRGSTGTIFDWYCGNEYRWQTMWSTGPPSVWLGVWGKLCEWICTCAIVENAVCEAGPTHGRDN